MLIAAVALQTVLKQYLRWTVQEPRIEGWHPFHYQSNGPGYPTGASDQYGAAAMPKVLAFLREMAPSIPKFAPPQ